MIFYRLTILFICVSFINCAQKAKQNLEALKMENTQVISKEKQITYAIHINAKTPYEIFLDDIPLPRFGRHYTSGMNATLELNSYLLSNGIHKLKIRYLPLETAKDHLLQPEDVFFSKDAKWNIFFVNYIKDNEDPLGYQGEIDYENSELTVVPPPNPVPFWEQTFDIEIKDLPYKLAGWSNSEDLSKLDEDVLEHEVFSYYNMLRDIMNNGEVDKYIQLNKKSGEEVVISTYDKDPEWLISDERKEDLISTCKGNMLPINKEDYTLRLYAHGKIVAIERINKFKNKSLVAKEENGFSGYSFKLHKPKGSDQFEIIR